MTSVSAPSSNGPSTSGRDLSQRLQIGKTLGSGAFAIVYKAVYDGRDVALKVLLPQHQPSHREDCPVRMFIREGELLRRLDHSHVVRCHAVLQLPPAFPGLLRGYSRPAWALVLELLEEGSMCSLMHKQLLAPWKFIYDNEQAMQWSIQTAGALAYLHSCNPPVIHRDVKLENVMLTRSEGKGSGSVAKLVDLGLHTCPLSLERCTRQTLLRVSMNRASSRRSFRHSASGTGVLTLDAAGPTNGGGGSFHHRAATFSRAASTADGSGHHNQQASALSPHNGAANMAASAPGTASAAAAPAAGGVISAAMEEERSSASCFYALQDDGSSAVPVDVRNNNMGERLRPLHGVAALPPLVLDGRVTLGPNCRPASGRMIRSGSMNGMSPLPRASTAGGGVLGSLVEVCEEEALRARASVENAAGQQQQQPQQQPQRQQRQGADAAADTTLAAAAAAVANALRPETASTDSNGSGGSGGTAAAPPTTTAGSTLNTSLGRSSCGDIMLPNLVNTGGGAAGNTASINMELQSRMPSYAESTATAVTDCGGSLFSMPPPPSLAITAAEVGTSSASAAAHLLAQHPSRRRLGGHHLLFRNSPAGSSFGGSANNTASGAAPDVARSADTAHASPFALAARGDAAGADGAAATAVVSGPSSMPQPAGTSPRAATAHAHQHHPTARSCLSAVTHANNANNVAASAAASSTGRVMSAAALVSGPASLTGYSGACAAPEAFAGDAPVLAAAVPAAALSTEAGGYNSRPATARDVSLGGLMDSCVEEAAGAHANLEVVYRLTGETGSCMAMAPEIRLQQPYNEKIDVYAFAILLFEVWSRSLLAVSHVGTKRPDMPEMIHKCEQFPDLIVSGWRPARAGAIPEPIWDIICECWDSDPLVRPSMADVETRLRQLLAEQPDTVIGLASGKGGKKLAASPGRAGGDGGGDGAHKAAAAGCGCVIC
ncbi:hypothetical protein HXX76_006397 [Chlamydomonas incerta]|uniref:Protein kinase domain-containing protein n=1 Tax=Chlamydomonas incerta TaxID=51695 RepID=A0A835T4I0_CHLIN|nr:hypothetical protein HXX76_006397 [Chlamydomonas incerta]|eukprot:KAG2436877.1 hypothetical protein HXX76_006397 [Chlamydomonas incerta]